VAVLSESGALASWWLRAHDRERHSGQRSIAERLLSSEWSRSIWNALYWALPKFFDVGSMNLNFVQGRPVGSLAPSGARPFSPP